MTNILHHIFLTLLISPEPSYPISPEILKHVNNLDHHKYSIRLKSFEYLKQNLDKNIAFLINLRNKITWQSEKKARLTLLINSYLDYPLQNIPSIYAIKFETRYIGGIDWSKYYYEQISDQYPEYRDSLGWAWRSRCMEERATLLLYKNLIENGVEKYKIINLMKDMLIEENKEQYYLGRDCIPHLQTGPDQSFKIYIICL